MQDIVATPHLRILHVLTLNGRNGEYGGPVRVARELCGDLSNRGHSTHIFSGAYLGSEPVPKQGLSESFVLVKPLSKKLPVSSLWSWNLIGTLIKLIKHSDIVHIHFARDLIPFLTAVISLFSRTPFVTQTHGMIISDNRISTRIIDILFTRPLLNKSRINLVLTATELSAVSKIGSKSASKVLPNGIFVQPKNLESHNKINRVVFCSRLNKRKGVDKYIEIADFFRESAIKFDIYGPDGGELELVKREIKNRNLEGVLEYKGALAAEEVLTMLSEIDLLILPSKDEPFPMVILEALSVGTSVLVMPSCGIARELQQFRSSFVSKTEDINGLVESFNEFLENSTSQNREKIINYCKSQFSIESVCNELEQLYFSLTSRYYGSTQSEI